MPKPPLIITRGTRRNDAASAETQSLTWQALQAEFRQAPLRAMLHRYASAELRLTNINRLHRPFATAMLLTLIAKRPRIFLGDDASTQRIGFRQLVHLGLNEVRDRIATRKLIGRVNQELDELQSTLASRSPVALRRDRQTIYLRTDLVFGLTSGGSVGHVAGVANQLAEQMSGLQMLTTDTLPGIDPNISQTRLNPGLRHWGQAERIALSANTADRTTLNHAVTGDGVAMIYHRYSLNNYEGLLLSCITKLPLVIEFNGSEPWIARQWAGKPLRYEQIAQRIESMNLQYADLVVVVSEPMRNTVIDLGASPERVLVNPNGVDPAVYRPDAEASDVIDRYALSGKTVVGFIGTFDRWHGAPILIEAIAILLARRPDLSDSLAVLMIGDGPQHAECKELVEKLSLKHVVNLIGRIPQAEGPAHLAACDILASPHVANEDGSDFFGSPTKLFEYMATGRAIVASSLGQIAEVLSHEEDALLTRWGDAVALSHAIELLIDDPAKGIVLGRAARKRALSHHTWERHVERILEKLETLHAL